MLKILIVEDDAQLATTLKYLVEDNPRYRVVARADEHPMNRQKMTKANKMTRLLAQSSLQDKSTQCQKVRLQN